MAGNFSGTLGPCAFEACKNLGADSASWVTRTGDSAGVSNLNSAMTSAAGLPSDR